MVQLQHVHSARALCCRCVIFCAYFKYIEMHIYIVIHYIVQSNIEKKQFWPISCVWHNVTPLLCSDLVLHIIFDIANHVVLLFIKHLLCVYFP